MEKIEYHLLPPVKRSVAVLADLTRYSLAACAGFALAELSLIPLRFPLAGIVSGIISSTLLAWCIALLAVLAAWCQPVLLAKQGIWLSRWLLRFGALLAPLVPICWIYSLACGPYLLYRQAELPLILGVFMLSAAVFNIFHMAAAPRALRIRVIALPLLLLLAYCCDMPGLLVFGTIFKLLAIWAAAAPLRQLASIAPRIISMPETK